MVAWLREFRACERGASAIEYGLVVGLVSVGIIGALAGIIGGVDTLMGQANTVLEDHSDDNAQ